MRQRNGFDARCEDGLCPSVTGPLRIIGLRPNFAEGQVRGAAPSLVGATYGRAEPILTTGGEAVWAPQHDSLGKVERFWMLIVCCFAIAEEARRLAPATSQSRTQEELGTIRLL